MGEETAVEMFVVGLVLDPNTQAPVVILKDEKGELHLPIWIGIPEATAIASAIKQLSMARPLTHDLMYDVVGELGAEIQRVVITDLKDSTYYAELIVSVGEKALIFDSRPSDAIALAIRASAPIYVAEHVVQQAAQSVPIEEGEGVVGGDGASAGEEEGESQEGVVDELEVEDELLGDQGKPKGFDFTEVDREKWNKLLEELDPDDFKYKV